MNHTEAIEMLKERKRQMDECQRDVDANANSGFDVGAFLRKTEDCVTPNDARTLVSEMDDESVRWLFGMSRLGLTRWCYKQIVDECENLASTS